MSADTIAGWTGRQTRVAIDMATRSDGQQLDHYPSL